VYHWTIKVLKNATIKEYNGHSQGTDSRVERSSRDSDVDHICGSDSVRGEECDGLLRRESGISEAGKNMGDVVSRLRDGQIGRWGEGGRPAEHELQTRRARTVGCSDGACEMDTEIIRVSDSG
jgi:hypothetical protein